MTQTFSDRQKDVLLLIADGWSIKGIADELGISGHSVKAHYDVAKNKIPIEKGQRNKVSVANWVNKHLRGKL